MNEDDSINLVLGIGVLVLVLSSLSLRRVSAGLLVRSLLGWMAIIGLIYLAVRNRDPIEAALGGIGERIGISGQSVEGDTVRIRQSPDGHFYARVLVNGEPTRMLVDSGATITALSVDTAERAGIDVSRAGLPVLLNTANGTVSARRATAQTISIDGQLETRDLSVVVSPSFGSVSVIGMNFLSRLGSWRVEQRTLILEPNRPQ